MSKIFQQYIKSVVTTTCPKNNNKYFKSIKVKFYKTPNPFVLYTNVSISKELVVTNLLIYSKIKRPYP